MRMRPLRLIAMSSSCNLRFENKVWKNNFKIVAGLDEVGRGCIAGPLVVAAVVFEKRVFKEWKMIRKDANGDLFLHYLGEHLISSISENVGMGNIKMLYNGAKEFANEEHQRFSELGNSKIALKYQKLMQYLDASGERFK